MMSTCGRLPACAERGAAHDRAAMGPYHQRHDQPFDDDSGGNTPYGQAKAALEAASAGWAADLAGNGVTCNVLIPGGAADTPMIPKEAPVDRNRLVSPAAMVAPLCYLASDASDGVTGMRFLASKWTIDGDPAANLERAMAPAAWPDLATPAGAPKRGSVVTA